MMFVLYVKIVNISSDEPCETFVLNYGIWRVKSGFESVRIFTLSFGFFLAILANVRSKLC